MTHAFVLLQGKNHSKKLRNFYAGSQQPPPIRIPEEAEPVSQQSLSTPPTDTGTAVGKPVNIHPRMSLFFPAYSTLTLAFHSFCTVHYSSEYIVIYNNVVV